VTSSSGLKTRQFRDIVEELVLCLQIHEQCNSRLGGVSLEFTGELNEEGFSVTECLGGSMGLAEDELGLRYQVGRGSQDPFSPLTVLGLTSLFAIPDSTLSNHLVCCFPSVQHSFAEENFRCRFLDFQVPQRTADWQNPIAG